MSKYKVKTKKGAGKRFKVTGSGKIMRRRSHTGHNTGKKTNSKMRRLNSEVEVPKSLLNKIKVTLGLK